MSSKHRYWGYYEDPHYRVISAWVIFKADKCLALPIHNLKEIKGIQIGKEEVKLSLFADDLILYTVNPKDTIRKLLELIMEFSKVTGYKVNTQKSLAFLHTDNKKSEREVKESIPFTISTKRIKYLGINLPNETKKTIHRKL